MVPDDTNNVTPAPVVDKRHKRAVGDHTGSFLFGMVRTRRKIGFAGDLESTCLVLVHCRWPVMEGKLINDGSNRTIQSCTWLEDLHEHVTFALFGQIASFIDLLLKKK